MTKQGPLQPLFTWMVKKGFQITNRTSFINGYEHKELAPLNDYEHQNQNGNFLEGKRLMKGKNLSKGRVFLSSFKKFYARNLIERIVEISFFSLNGYEHQNKKVIFGKESGL